MSSAAQQQQLLAVDELGSALQAGLVLSTLKKQQKDNKPATAISTTAKSDSHDRTRLLDESQIDYGYLGKTGGGAHNADVKDTFYVTTAINYTNGPAHMGHAYEGTTSDVIARYQRSRGDRSVYFLTGSDEHGQKVATTAAEAGVEPIDWCNKWVQGFQNINQRTLVTNDDYLRTTSDRHKATAQELWRRCAANNDDGDIYLDQYEGWYNVKEETFVTENEAQLSDYKDPSSGQPLKKVQEASYFFKMSKYREQLIEFIESHDTFIQPSHHKNQILARLKEDELRDLSISRTTFSWGIPVPEGFDQSHVMYVWMDALTNYITGIDLLQQQGTAGLQTFWPANVHIIGKDILWFHTVIWPCLLMSAKLPLPKQVFAHGFVNDKEGKKMSKSLGNVVDPHDMLDKFHVDTFRWYLCKEAPYGGELSFSEENMRDMHNADLVGTLGNGVHRATTLCQKPDFCNGVIPDVPLDAKTLPDFMIQLGDLIDNYQQKMEALELQMGAQLAIQGFRDINGYLAKEEPWKLKGDDHKAQRQVIVRTALEAIYAMAHLLMPFLPIGCKAIFQKLNTPPLSLVELKKRHEATPGCFLTVGTKIEAGGVLYEPSRSEEELKDAAAAAAKKKESHAEAQKRKKEAKAAAIAKSKAASAGGGSDPNQPEFTKMEIRVGLIQKVWHHESADKLFCEEIDVGEAEGPRQIASGLRQFYTLEEMQNRKVLVVCNLKAAKIQGFSSNGMVLAAKSEDGTKVELVAPPDDAPVGERVMIEGLTGEPLSSAQTKKRKTWDAVAKDLKTGEGGVATWEGKPITTSKGVCKASTLVGVPIS